jgi:DNA-binding MarR family transcriptional regulator
MSSNLEKPQDAPVLAGPAEPDPFTPSEFAAWRGMLRVHSSAMRELDRRLLDAHGFGVDAYGVLITLVTAPGGTLTMGELAERRNLSPSGISRAVDRLTRAGLVQRTTNPADGRSLLVGLTVDGLSRLREAQVTHHSTARELLLARLDEHDLTLLSELFEKAMPGSVSSSIWPRPPDSTNSTDPVATTPSEPTQPASAPRR